jgi:cupin 2 domain-containing protein
MQNKPDNLFQPAPAAGGEEFFQTLTARDGVRIERIVSRGHCSPPGFWYDQEENEWVALLKGEALLRFEKEQRAVHLRAGDYLEIAAHERHRVDWTAPDGETVWLAVFY